MNLFVVDPCPAAAGVALCDKHVGKMLIEAVQLMSNCHHLHESTKAYLCYRPTHVHNQLTQWICGNARRYSWVRQHAQALAEEYLRRFGTMHAAEDTLEVITHPPLTLDVGPLEPMVQAMPEQYRADEGDLSMAGTVAAYRRYYAADKRAFARWDRGTPPPSWWEC